MSLKRLARGHVQVDPVAYVRRTAVREVDGLGCILLRLHPATIFSQLLQRASTRFNQRCRRPKKHLSVRGEIV